MQYLQSIILDLMEMRASLGQALSGTILSLFPMGP